MVELDQMAVAGKAHMALTPDQHEILDQALLGLAAMTGRMDAMLYQLTMANGVEIVRPKVQECIADLGDTVKLLRSLKG